ncbi:MAG: hypothetical protein RSB82_00585 [Victivallaceae bacterium]
MSFLVADFFDPETHIFPELFYDVTYCWDVLDGLDEFFSKYVFRGIRGVVEEGVILKNSELIEIREGAIIESGACLIGPIVIGTGTVIRTGAYVRSKVVIGNDCVIGHGTEIKSSVLFNRVKACHFAYIGDSIIGNRVNLGAGVKLANMKLDKQEIFVTTSSGDRMATGRRKMGGVLGDDVSIGCNAVLNPGTFIIKGCSVLPLSCLSGLIN